MMGTPLAFIRKNGLGFWTSFEMAWYSYYRNRRAIEKGTMDDGEKTAH